MLEKIVTAMDELYAQAEQLHDTDVRGDIYEYLLSKIATAGSTASSAPLGTSFG